MFPSSVEEGKLWPKAMAGVVRPARVPTTPGWLPPREGFSSLHPLLIQGELFLVLMAPCIKGIVHLHIFRRPSTGTPVFIGRGDPHDRDGACLDFSAETEPTSYQYQRSSRLQPCPYPGPARSAEAQGRERLLADQSRRAPTGKVAQCRLPWRPRLEP